jgi:hypothetical protein
LAIFCPTKIDQQPAPLNRDNTNLTIDPDTDIRRCERDKEIWAEINEKVEYSINFKLFKLLFILGRRQFSLSNFAINVGCNWPCK